MKRYFLISACLLLFVLCPMTARAQVDCATIGQAELLHCDIPSDPTIAGIAGLSIQRGGNYHCYRMPRIVIRRTNGSEAAYPIFRSDWEYKNNGQKVETTFRGSDGLTGATFVMSSTAAFSPLSGMITINGLPITFRTCGNQTTTAYYWTQSSQNPLEAFSCPLSLVPKRCPSVGYNP